MESLFADGGPLFTPVKRPKVRAKHMPVVKPKSIETFNPETFETFGITTDNPDEVLQHFKPAKLFGNKYVFFDTETKPLYSSSQDVPKNRVRRFVGSGKNAVPQDIPFVISIGNGVDNYTVRGDEETLRRLAPIFEDPTTEKVAHNIKFDMHMLENIGITLRGNLNDTLVLAKLVNENRKTFVLKAIAAEHGGIIKYEDAVDYYKRSHRIKRYDELPEILLGSYANADIFNCYLVFSKEYPKLEDEKLLNVYCNECECIRPLYMMERIGMQLDAGYEQTLKQELQAKADQMESEIYEAVGHKFNLNSTAQLYQALLETGCDDAWIPKTDKGNPSLDKKSMDKLANHYGIELVNKVLAYRQATKLLVTYAYGIYEQRDSSDRIHANINQCEATTGRMSITKPAMQTIPRDDKHIKRAVIPDQNCYLVYIDYSQVEYRVYAHYMKSEHLIDLINKDYDVHAATAALLAHEDVDSFVARLHAEDKTAKAQRQRAKTINFALLYGVGAPHLGELLGIPLNEARAVKTEYFSAIPEASIFVNKVQQVIAQRGYVRNFYGRRRRLKADECYKGPNALIQGCAADIMKEHLALLYQFIQKHQLKTKLINIVHDEVQMMVPEDELPYVPYFKACLEDVVNFRTKIKADIEMSNVSWANKEEVEMPEVNLTHLEVMQLERGFTPLSLSV